MDRQEAGEVMDYFRMCQDERIFYKPQLLLPDTFHLKDAAKEQTDHITAAEIIYVKENYYNEYAGYIDTPLKLVSKNIKQILSKYQRDISFKPVVLIEKESNRQENYYLMAAPEAECALELLDSELPSDRQEFILDEEKIKHLRVFSAKDCNGQLFVRLDVAESILRRKAYGIMFEKVKIKKRGGQDE